MAERNKHLFQFTARRIADAAEGEVKYADERIAYWQQEMDAAAEKVRATAGVKVEKRDVSGGWQYDVVVAYGDPVAYTQMQRAARKIQDHQKNRDRFGSDAQLYGTQGERQYDLDAEDVAHFRFNGRARED